VLALPVVAMAAIGCGDDGAAPATTAADGCREADAGRVTIVARDLAWDTGCLSAPADEPVVIVVDNRDSAVNHNLHLTDAPDQPTTALEEGPVRQELAVTLPAGTYRYVCDIHPTMVGALVVGLQVTPPR